MRKIEKHITSPWIILAILSGLGIVAVYSETRYCQPFQNLL